ncbi:hypothetical protein M404DRAFT_115437, partial [Pisolithus tinctorius Marx 270]
LYWQSNAEKDTELEILGRKLYEQFDVVVRLKTQVRVTDPDWMDLLQHVRHGNCKERHIAMLRSLVLTNDQCAPADFTQPPWSNALLVTPRHAVRIKWNMMAVKSRTQSQGVTLFTCPAVDTVDGRQLTLEEQFAVAAKPKGSRGRSRQERGGLPDEVHLAIGMEVMVT